MVIVVTTTNKELLSHKMQGKGVNLLFPSTAIDSLQTLRGEDWQTLVKSVIRLEPNDPDRIAFVLLMVKLGGCTGCQSDSFRAMRGCGLCSSTTIKRYKGNDQSLINLYNEAKNEISKYMEEV